MEQKKRQLEQVLNDFKTRRCIRIELVWSNYERSGIGNPTAINIAMTALLDELMRQINELN